MATKDDRQVQEMKPSTTEQLRAQVEAELKEIAAMKSELRAALDQLKSGQSPKRKAADMRREGNARLEAQRKAAQVGSYEYHVSVKGFRQPLKFRCEKSDVLDAIGTFNYRFGTQFDKKKMEIRLAKQHSSAA